MAVVIEEVIATVEAEAPPSNGAAPRSGQRTPPPPEVRRERLAREMKLLDRRRARLKAD
jgi:hypothetical protein